MSRAGSGILGTFKLLLEWKHPALSSPCTLPVPTLVSSGALKSCEAALWFNLLCMKEMSTKCIQGLSMCNNCLFKDADFLAECKLTEEWSPGLLISSSVLVAIGELAGG